MVADFMASFMRHKRFYEYQNYRYPGTDRFGIFIADDVTGEYRDRGAGIVVRPRTPRYRAPVVAIVDNATISSGEGVALGIGEMGNGRVVGFSGTNGSFGMSGDGALMPGGYEVDWPFGQSLNKEGREFGRWTVETVSGASCPGRSDPFHRPLCRSVRQG